MVAQNGIIIDYLVTMNSRSNSKKRSKGIFVPICLYSTSFYYQKRNIEYLYDNFLKFFPKSLIVIADDLKAYNLIIRNEENDSLSAIERARKKGDEIRNMVENSLKKFNDNRIQITKWIDLKETKSFKQIFENVKNEIEADPDLEIIVEQFIKYNLHKFSAEGESDSHIYERLYIFEEISMSIYATEILGFTTELWEKIPEKHSPDPLKYLFENKRSTLKRITGKPFLDRNFLTIFSDEMFPDSNLTE